MIQSSKLGRAGKYNIWLSCTVKLILKSVLFEISFVCNMYNNVHHILFDKKTHPRCILFHNFLKTYEITYDIKITDKLPLTRLVYCLL